MLRKQKNGLGCVLFLIVLSVVIYIYFGFGGSISELSPTSRQRNNVEEYEASRSKWKYTPDWLFQNPRGLIQNDSAIIDYIRKYHLTPPSTKPYNLVNPNVPVSRFWNHLLPYLDLNRTGFFIESGALDGETDSNTLHLEKHYNWKGLLVEPNPMLLGVIRLKHRKAWMADVALSYTDSPLKIEFNSRLDIYKPNTGYNHQMGMLKNSDANPHPPSTVYDSIMHPKDFVSLGFVECFPVFSILSALNVTEVDYFSLDIQGPELKVLKTIPFDAIKIKVMTVEFILDPEGIQPMKKFLESKNYEVKQISQDDILAVQKDHHIRT